MSNDLALMDSISSVGPQHRGAVVVSGSHAGLSAAALALAGPPDLVVLNDAGLGKQDAGVAGLAVLDTAGVAACAVAHTSARIGEASDTLASGVVSVANARARAGGIRPGMTTREALSTWWAVDRVRVRDASGRAEPGRLGPR